MSSNVSGNPEGHAPPVGETTTPIEDKDEVVVDEKTKETIVIPSDVSTTGLKFEDGNPVPDRVVTVLLAEYGEYPQDTGANFVKEGDIQVTQDAGKDHDRILEVQRYVKKDPETEKTMMEDDGKTPVYMEIRRTIMKNHYPVVLKLREMINKEKMEKAVVVSNLSHAEFDKQKALKAKSQPQPAPKSDVVTI